MSPSPTVSIAFHPDSAAEGAIAVTVPSQEALLADLKARLADGRGFAVATLNLDHVVKLRRDEAFREAYGQHTHVTADGNPIVWLHRLAGRRIELVTGADLILPLMQTAARLQVPVGFLGSTDETLTEAARALEETCPGLQIAARIAPPMGFDPDGPEADVALDALHGKGARLCLIALGAPKQEQFAARGLDRHPGMGFVSIGAGLDFIAGTQWRAPDWARAVAMEWAWRLLSNPVRLGRRYAECVLVLPGLGKRALKQRRVS